jgi:hypothetical protein
MNDSDVNTEGSVDIDEAVKEALMLYSSVSTLALFIGLGLAITLPRGGKPAFIRSLTVAAGAEPTLAINFSNNLGWLNGAPASISSLLTCARASSGYYTNADGTLQSFGSNTLRYGSNGLLEEEARTNLIIQSQTFETADWSTVSSSIIADSTTAPDGTTTADRIVEIANVSEHTLFTAAGVVATAVNHTETFYLKAGERNWAFVFIALGGDHGTFVNLSTGVLGNTVGTIVSKSIEALANGWYRIAITKLLTAATWFPAISLATGDGVAREVYLGDITKGIYVWGAQLEVGAFATSYIPTTSASVTRAADLVLSSSASYISATAGTLYAKGKTFDTSAIRGLGEIVGTDGIDFRITAAALLQSIGTGFSAITANAVTINTLFKAVVAVAANDLAVCLNGGTVATDASGTMVSSPTSLQVGDIDGAVTSPFNGYITEFAYWNTRRANANLQLLTA